MDEVERIADNLIILERGRLRAIAEPEVFCARVTHWVADLPFRGPDPRSVPGLLEARKLDGLHHYYVLDQDAAFERFLRDNGARSVQSMPVALDRAVNAFLARNHVAPASTTA
jgi:ABC-2 type transport system ATP-binding protein